MRRWRGNKMSEVRIEKAVNNPREATHWLPEALSDFSILYSDL
jgi:hypothetical protein